MNRKDSYLEAEKNGKGEGVIIRKQSFRIRSSGSRPHAALVASQLDKSNKVFD